MPLVTLEEFKHQLGVTEFVTDDTLLMMKLNQATALVLQYIERSDDATQAEEIASWGNEAGTGSPANVPVPYDVQAAILQWATELYRFRGDDPDEVKRANPTDPSDTVASLLGRRRRKVFA